MEDMETKQLNVEVDAPLVIRAKKAAIDRRTTLRALVIEGLIAVLDGDKPRQPSHSEFYR
jgi:hypothetical protein